MTETSFLNSASLWVAVSFIIFLYLTIKYLLPLINNGLDNRAVNISTEIEESGKLKDEARNLLLASQKEEAESQLQSDSIVSGARKESEDIISNSEENINRILAVKLEQLNNKKKNIISEGEKEISSHIISKAGNIALNILKDQINKQKDKQIIANTVASLKTRLKSC